MGESVNTCQECDPKCDCHTQDGDAKCAELRPCPFCGGTAHVVEYEQTVECRKCSASTYSSDSVYPAIEQWNRRAPVSSEVVYALKMLADWCDDNVADPALTVPLGYARAALRMAGRDQP